MANSEIDLKVFGELREMSGGDFINELLDTFLEDAPRLIEQLKSALAAMDTDSFRRAAHSLKSNAATFGAQHLSELAKELETLGKESRLGDTGDRLGALETSYQAAAAELRGLKA